MNRVRGWMAAALTAPLVLGAVGHGAMAADRNRLVAPAAHGPVDFGDRVGYRLDGGRCTSDAVRVVAAGGHRRAVRGPSSRPKADPLRPGSCVGEVVVPAEREVRRTGWDDGDMLTLTLRSRRDSTPLVYQRLHVEHGEPVVAGNPITGGATTVTPSIRDPRAGRRDRAVQMRTGDVVSLGRADLTHVRSVTLRVCLTATRPRFTPSFVELRAGSADGPAVVGPVDVADDYPYSPKSKANFGWPNCWQSQPWPLTRLAPERAPELFLVVTATAHPVLVSYVDLNGTGAKIPDRPPRDPGGTRTLFDGRSFAGWATTACRLDEGSARNVPNNAPAGYVSAVPALGTFAGGPAGCSMTYTKRKLKDVGIRFEFRMPSYNDNGAVMIGGREIQLRQAGEYLTGGLTGDLVRAGIFSQWAPDELDGVQDFSGGGYPAQRVKVNSGEHWNQMEIVQVGARHVVRLNGRTVADCSDCWPDPAPYELTIASQPQHGWHVAADLRMDNNTMPVVTQPSEWSDLSFRNIRVYDCRSKADPVCIRGPGVRG